ncbi:hypothetical protein D3C86_1893420 [compost metagenome]
MQDDALKAEFVADPNAVASRVLGIQIPAFVKLMPVEVPANAILVPLPAKMSEDELSDLDLELVAGGKTKAGHFFQAIGFGIAALGATVFTGANSSQTQNLTLKFGEAYDNAGLQRPR